MKRHFHNSGVFFIYITYTRCKCTQCNIYLSSLILCNQTWNHLKILQQLVGRYHFLLLCSHGFCYQNNFTRNEYFYKLQVVFLSPVLSGTKSVKKASVRPGLKIVYHVQHQAKNCIKNSRSSPKFFQNSSRFRPTFFFQTGPALFLDLVQFQYEPGFFTARLILSGLQ